MRTVFGSTRRLAARIITISASILVFSTLLTNPANARQAYSGIVMDAKTGKVLYDHRGTARAYPASLTKMMTLYMLFDAMEKGQVNKNTRIRFSNHAASMQPSKLGVKAGGSISAEQAIYALVTKSANDAAAAVGEHLGGSESKFAEMMTAKARSIGMDKTTFKNASGLPDSRQVTTAKDMAILGIALREHFPDKYRYFSARSFKYGNKNFANHNRLLGKVRGIDGIKTGYTRDSGFNLVSSVEDQGRSIVAVVMGGKSGSSRNAQMEGLIAQYLSKASRGKDRMVVARSNRGGSSTGLLASLIKKKEPAVIPAPNPIVVETKTRTIASVASVTVVPTTSPKVATDPVVTASVEPTPIVETVKAGGWHVQIGAMPSEENAISHLEKARAKLPSILSKVSNYTETVEKNGTKLYRARFAGFSSKDAAWDACAELKKIKYNCLALAQ